MCLHVVCLAEHVSNGAGRPAAAAHEDDDAVPPVRVGAAGRAARGLLPEGAHQQPAHQGESREWTQVDAVAEHLRVSV